VNYLQEMFRNVATFGELKTVNRSGFDRFCASFDFEPERRDFCYVTKFLMEGLLSRRVDFIHLTYAVGKGKRLMIIVGSVYVGDYG